MNLNRNYIQFVVLVSIFLHACGYRFAGGGNLPNGIRSIRIQILENRTAETGVESLFTNDLIYEITKNRKAILTSSQDADATLTGVIESIRSETISRAGQLTAIEKRVTAVVDLKLTDPGGKLIWSAKGVSENEAYDASGDKQLSERNKRTAIEALSKRLAEKIYRRLTDDF